MRSNRRCDNEAFLSFIQCLEYPRALGAIVYFHAQDANKYIWVEIRYKKTVIDGTKTSFLDDLNSYACEDYIISGAKDCSRAQFIIGEEM